MRTLQVRHYRDGRRLPNGQPRGESSLQWVWELDSETEFERTGSGIAFVSYGRRFRMRETAGVKVGHRLVADDGRLLKVLEVRRAKGRFVIVDAGG